MCIRDSHYSFENGNPTKYFGISANRMTLSNETSYDGLYCGKSSLEKSTSNPVMIVTLSDLRDVVNGKIKITCKVKKTADATAKTTLDVYKRQRHNAPFCPNEALCRR